MVWYSGKGLDIVLDRTVDEDTYSQVIGRPETTGRSYPKERTVGAKRTMRVYALSHIGEPWTVDQALPSNTISRWQKLNYLASVRVELAREGYVLRARRGSHRETTYVVEAQP